MGSGRNIKNNIARAVLDPIFARLIKDRQHSGPKEQNISLSCFKSADGTTLSGWAYSGNSNPPGTLFILHGFCEHSGKDRYWQWARAIHDAIGLTVCSFDFRFHGNSENAIPTFGIAEYWDVKAVMDEAEKHTLPKPYLLMGESLGGMAAQNAAIRDSRVAGAICIHTPGWPWNAISVNVSRSHLQKVIQDSLRDFKQEGVKKVINSLIPNTDVLVWFGHLINAAYGSDVLGDGDIRRQNGNPSHRPKVLYIVGDRDYYNYQQTEEVWKHWYGQETAVLNSWPIESPGQNKWFVVVPNAVHPPDHPDVTEWEMFQPLVREFIDVVLRCHAL